ncbi:Uncharacterised protein [uncultured archaeon]|nr:Uncharacterised protein [uncultured archaeon]
MSWYAIDALDPAFNYTKNILFKPFRLNWWLKVGLIACLLGAGGFRGSMPNPSGESKWNATSLTPAVVAVVLAVLVFVLVFTYISSVAQFMLLDAVLKKEDGLIASFKRNAEKGLSLFLFQMALLLAALGIVVAAVAAGIYVSENYAKPIGTAATILIILAALTFFICFVVAISVVSMFVTDLVLPQMTLLNRPLLTGLRRVLSSAKKEPSQYIAYVLMKIPLGMASAMVSFPIGMTVFLIGLIVFGIPAAVVAIPAYLIFKGSAVLTLLIAVFVVYALSAILILGYASVVLTLPITVYFRAYSLYFLKATDAEMPLEMLAEKKTVKQSFKTTTRTLKETTPKRSGRPTSTRKTTSAGTKKTKQAGRKNLRVY